MDPASGSVVGRVPTGDGPHELVTSTDGKIAFASNYGTGPAPGHTISSFTHSVTNQPIRVMRRLLDLSTIEV